MRPIPLHSVVVWLAVVPSAGGEPACGPVASGLIVAEPPPSQTEFGASLDVNGDRMIIGDPGYDPPGATVNTGGAFIFTRIAGAWRQEAILTLLDVPLLDELGWATVIEGDSAVISTPFNNRSAGEAFAFRRQPDGGWMLEANIKPDPKTTPRLFGFSLDFSNGVLAIGALRSADDPAGWVDLYARFSGVWLRRAHLAPPDGEIFDEFGHAVALDGERIIIGAPSHRTTVFGGAAYIFLKSDGGWFLEQKLVPPELDHGDRAGHRVAIDRGLAAVSGPGANFASGRVWMYRLDAGEWALDTILEDRTGGANRSLQFGERLALRGDRLIVGAPETNGGAGAVYLYQRVDDAWVFHGRLLASEVSTPAAQRRDLGRAVAVEGTAAFASAPMTTLLPSARPPLLTGSVQQISLAAPSFGVTRQPADLDAAPGGSLVLSAAATGPGPLAYRWFRAGAALADDGRITGSASPILTIADTTIEDSALYSVRVTSPECGQVESRRALIDLGGCPSVLSHPPEEQMLLAGEPIVLHSQVDAPIGAELRWFAGLEPLQNGGRITGADSQSLTINPTIPGDSSIYYLTVTSPCGQIESDPSTVSFFSCVEIVRQPAPVFSFIGDNVQFEAVATSHLPLAYLWWRNGMLLEDGGRYSGSRTAILSIHGAQAVDQGQFTCIVSCGFNAIASTNAGLTLLPQDCLGDANLDHAVNMIDVSTVLDFWGASYRPATGQGDADRDGLVNFDDLSIVLSRFGDPCR